MLVLVFLAAVALAQNPFAGKKFYVNPSYQKELDSSIATATGITKQNLIKMRNVSSAYWIDVMSKINGKDTDSVEGILADAARSNPAPLVLFIVYDVPNRDCHAKASNGEICCAPNPDGTCNYDVSNDCSQGLQTYMTKYIDPIAALFRKYQDVVPIVAVIEPDSLPNLSTNTGDPHCGSGATQTAYMKGISVNTINSQAPKVAMYVDAAHGGWLGWSDNTRKFVSTIQQLNIIGKIRGFATNVANYQPVGIACPQVGWCLNGQHQSDPCCADPCKLEGQYNPGQNEANYIFALTTALKQLNFNGYFISDTGRNGVPDMRNDCANWCNIRGAGVGRLPTANTGNSQIDAFFWLKTPGESDGCTQMLPSGGSCPRFDSMCASADSLGSQSGEPRAPQAGNWFDYQVKQLALNAHFDGEH